MPATPRPSRSRLSAPQRQYRLIQRLFARNLEQAWSYAIRWHKTGRRQSRTPYPELTCRLARVDRHGKPHRPFRALMPSTHGESITDGGLTVTLRSTASGLHRIEIIDRSAATASEAASAPRDNPLADAVRDAQG